MSEEEIAFEKDFALALAYADWSREGKIYYIDEAEALGAPTKNVPDQNILWSFQRVGADENERIVTYMAVLKDGEFQELLSFCCCAICTNERNGSGPRWFNINYWLPPCAHFYDCLKASGPTSSTAYAIIKARHLRASTQ